MSESRFSETGSAWDQSPESMPVFGTIASKFNDDGVTALYHAILDTLADKTTVRFHTRLPKPDTRTSTSKTIIIPPERTRYLAEISDTIRKYHKKTETQAEAIRTAWHLEEAIKSVEQTLSSDMSALLFQLKDETARAKKRVEAESRAILKEWDDIKAAYTQDMLTYEVRDCDIKVPLYTESLSHKKIPKISIPRFKDPGEIYRWMREENVPGRFPYTGGVFPLKRVGEDPTRMFAGEGDPARTNRRFKLLSGNYDAKRLSTAFDSVTLYGYDPETRPDIYGKIGTSGVSICTLDDVKILYGGFDLCAPSTSVSMTINGPAPIILAMFMNTAIDQQVDKFTEKNGRAAIRRRICPDSRQGPFHGPGNGSGRYSERRPGTEHLHFLH